MIPGTRDDWTQWLAERGREIVAAIAFSTRLPLARVVPAETSSADLAQSIWALPLAGLLVGAVGALVYAIAHRLGVPAWPAAALTIAATLALTGCLHEDGLADTADGFGGGATRERKLDIMRDSRIGAYGVCALVVSILIRAGVLASLADPGWVAWALLAAHGAGRAHAAGADVLRAAGARRRPVGHRRPAAARAGDRRRGAGRSHSDDLSRL